MLFNEDIIKMVLAKNNIISVIKEYTKLEKNGKYFIGLCPFHKETVPSFCVDYTKKTYYCYGCGEGGNVINFIMHVKKCSFEEAVCFLAQRVKITMPKTVTFDDDILDKKSVLVLLAFSASFFASLSLVIKLISGFSIV